MRLWTCTNIVFLPNLLKFEKDFWNKKTKNSWSKIDLKRNFGAPATEEEIVHQSFLCVSSLLACFISDIALIYLFICNIKEVSTIIDTWTHVQANDYKKKQNSFVTKLHYTSLVPFMISPWFTREKKQIISIPIFLIGKFSHKYRIGKASNISPTPPRLQ